MIPTVRSRLLGAAVAFGLGFGLANYAIFLIPRPDQWLWVGFAVVLIATSAWAVVIADSRRRISVWAVIGLEVFAVITLVPFVWLVTLAASPTGEVPTNLWPNALDTRSFELLADSVPIRDAALNSLSAAGLATLVAIPIAAFAAGPLARSAHRPSVARAVVVMALLFPWVVVAVAADDLAVRAGVVDRWWVTGLVQVAITAPLATWLFARALTNVPWQVVEVALADGASRRAVMRTVLWPSVGWGLVTAVLVVFVVATQDLLLGASVTTTSGSGTLTSVLAARAADPEQASLIAATGLVWMIPPLVVIVLFSRPLVRLLGRSYR